MRNILSADSEKTSFGNVQERVAFAGPTVLLEHFAAFSRVVCAYAFVVVTGEFQWTVTLGNFRVAQNNRSKLFDTLTVIESNSLAGYFRHNWSNLCTRL
jgi:hypothetical protein